MKNTKSSPAKDIVKAMGIVFGDIGTSPIYTLSIIFTLTIPSKENIYGILSLIFWTLITLVTIQYAWLAMSMSTKGEGGIIVLKEILITTLKKGRKIGFVSFLVMWPWPAPSAGRRNGWRCARSWTTRWPGACSPPGRACWMCRCAPTRTAFRWCPRAPGIMRCGWRRGAAGTRPPAVVEPRDFRCRSGRRRAAAQPRWPSAAGPARHQASASCAAHRKSRRTRCSRRDAGC